jgi:hypothetical protein
MHCKVSHLICTLVCTDEASVARLELVSSVW